LIPFGRSYGEALNTAKSPFDTTTPKAAFPPGITSIDSIGPNRYGEPAEGRGRGRATNCRAASSSGRGALSWPAQPSRSEAPAFKAELSAITGAKEIIDAASASPTPPGAVLALHH
jgi:hypothetical protein